MVAVHAWGDVGVTDEGREVPLGGPRQRRLLAVLLVHRGTVVSADRIAEAVFAGHPTPGASTTLRSYVARLRRVLNGPGSTVQVVTRAPGYRLDVAAEDFDVARFEAALAGAREALQEGDAELAGRRARAALEEVRGDPYAEFADEEWVYAEVQRLHELALTAHELLVDAELARGRAEMVTPLVESLCTRFPLRESYRAQLMTAYAGTGRQADALAAFRAFRTELAEELGIDPSPELVELERRILEQDPTLAIPRQRGTSLRGYLLGDRLGSSHRGTVRAATLPGVDQEFVVKKLRAEVADDPGFIRSFEATARRVAALRHPAVLPLHDYWREPGAAYLVMPRVTGGSLRNRLHRGPLGLAELVEVVEKVGDALAVAHAHDVVHGRLAADNVLYDGRDPVVTDFWVGEDGSPPDPNVDVTAYVDLVGQCLAACPEAPPGLDTALSNGHRTVADLLPHLRQGLAGERTIASTGARTNPYRGLRAFDETDADWFFGRTALVDRMVRHLAGNGTDARPGPAGRRLLLVVGASGTGKSSVVRAGLVPRLHAGAVPGSERWFVATMMPGSTPYRALAEALRTIATAPDSSATPWPVEELVARVRVVAGDKPEARCRCRRLA